MPGRPVRPPLPGERSGRDRLLLAGVLALGMAPLARLVALGFTDGLGANPVEFVTRSTGTWTLAMLCATLAVTPVRRLTGWQRIARVRRAIGLLCFGHAALHALTYVWFDQWFELAAIGRDILERPFITAGAAAFALLVPLAATSTDAARRRLGRAWAQLHRAVYAVAVLALLHYAWHKAGKNDFAEPLAWAVAIAALAASRALPARSAAQRGSGRSNS